MVLKQNRVTFRVMRDALYRQGPLSLGAIYGMPHGGRRRKLLLEWLAGTDPEGGARCIYVNRKWQANLVDPDLQHLLKKGLLVQRRQGGGRQHPMNRSSRTRQSYLVLAAADRQL